MYCGETNYTEYNTSIAFAHIIIRVILESIALYFPCETIPVAGIDMILCMTTDRCKQSRANYSKLCAPDFSSGEAII